MKRVYGGFIMKDGKRDKDISYEDSKMFFDNLNKVKSTTKNTIPYSKRVRMVMQGKRKRFDPTKKIWESISNLDDRLSFIGG